MDKLLLFVEQLGQYNAKIVQKGSIIEFSLNYSKLLDSLISYSNIVELNSLYPKAINSIIAIPNKRILIP